MSASPPAPAGIDLRASRQPQIYGATITTFILAVIAVSLRILSRRIADAGVRLDDYLAIASAVSPPVARL